MRPSKLEQIGDWLKSVAQVDRPEGEPPVPEGTRALFDQLNAAKENNLLAAAAQVAVESVEEMQGAYTWKADLLKSLGVGACASGINFLLVNGLSSSPTFARYHQWELFKDWLPTTSVLLLLLVL